MDITPFRRGLSHFFKAMLKGTFLRFDKNVNIIYKANYVYGRSDRRRQTPRERRRAKRLEAIRGAAMELVIEDGVENFSVHRLAEKVDLTVGALYRYFSGVDEILMAIQIDVLQAFDGYLARVEARFEGQRALERAAILCAAYSALERLQPARFCLLSRFVSTPEPVFDDEVAGHGIAPTRRLLDRLATVLAEALADGDLGAVEAQSATAVSIDRAVIAWSSLQGLVDRRKLARLAPDLFEIDRLVLYLLKTLFIGWGCSEGRAAEAIAMIPEIDVFEKTLEEVTY